MLSTPSRQSLFNRQESRAACILHDVMHTDAHIIAQEVVHRNERGISCKIYHPFRHILDISAVLRRVIIPSPCFLLHCDFRRASASDVMGFFRRRWFIVRIFSLPEQSFLSLLTLQYIICKISPSVMKSRLLSMQRV